MTGSPGVLAALPGVVRVLATDPGCSRRTESSGFVFAPHHVLMTAHGVAGAARTGLRAVTSQGRSYRATVVLFDPVNDIAVLDARALPVPPLRFAAAVRAGSDAVIAGYPLGRSSPAAAAAFVRASVNGAGKDIEGATVHRQLLLTEGKVAPGESGGPLPDEAGEAEGVVYAAGHPAGAYVLSASQIHQEVTAAAARTRAVPDHSCL